MAGADAVTDTGAGAVTVTVTDAGTDTPNARRA
jgi:hypothetical protein